MSADYTPSMHNYKNMGHFKMWCQKVLPLVYDDSLSYYEVLCKVIQYINDTTDNVDGLYEDMQDLYSAYNLLQTYVNNYFDNLNVQTEINNKLDAMVLDGTMDELLSPIVGRQIGGVVAEQIGDVVGTQIGAVVANQLPSEVATQLPDIAAQAASTEVGSWLETHIDPDTGYVIDDTLTVSNAAADAKAVGDEFTSIKSALSRNTIRDMQEFGGVRIFENYAVNAQGVFLSNASFKALMFCTNKQNSEIVFASLNTSKTLRVIGFDLDGTITSYFDDLPGATIKTVSLTNANYANNIYIVSCVKEATYTIDGVIDTIKGAVSALETKTNNINSNLQDLYGRTEIELNNESGFYDFGTIEQGGLNDNGTDTPSSTRIRTKGHVIFPNNVETVTIKKPNNLRIAFIYFKPDGTTEKSGWIANENVTLVSNNIRAVVSYTNDAVILPSAFDDITIFIPNNGIITLQTTEQRTRRAINELKTIIDLVGVHPVYGIDTYLNTGKMQYAAHRGARLDAPEGSIPAFELAGQQGYEWLNIQIRTSKDGTWYVFHDSTLTSKTDAETVYPDAPNYNFENFTDAELANIHIDTGAHIGDYSQSDLVIPTLEQAIQIARKYGMKIYFRMNGFTNYATDQSDWGTLIAMVRKYSCERMLFGGNTFDAIKPIWLNLGLQWCINWDTYSTEDAEAQIQAYIDNGIKNATLFTSNTLITDSLITLAKSNGYKVMVFDPSTGSPTINKARALELSNMGVDIISGVVHYNLAE